MRSLLSILFELGPSLVAVWWNGRRGEGQKKMLAHDLGWGFAASGSLSWFGVQYFDLFVFGKTFTKSGEKGAHLALRVAETGIAIVALHYLVVFFAPIIARFFRGEGANESARANAQHPSFPAHDSRA